MYENHHLIAALRGTLSEHAGDIFYPAPEGPIVLADVKNPHGGNGIASSSCAVAVDPRQSEHRKKKGSPGGLPFGTATFLTAKQTLEGRERGLVG
jgi:hypothetical protein